MKKVINMDRNEGFSPGYCEYLVDGFAGTKIKALRFFAVLLGVVLSFLVFLLLMKIPQVFFLWLVVIVGFEMILFRLTKCEFEYTVAMGEMTVEAIYGRRFRKKIFVVRIADADRVFPVTSFKDEAIARLGAEKVIYASPKKSEFMYCLFTKDKGGKNSKTALVFSSCKKLSDAVKFYNRACFIEK